ncbi:MAG: 2-keto-4-pentenoate hydratase, partial [Methylococcales bacterium]
MKLASLKSTDRDGMLVLVNQSLSRMKLVTDIAPNLQSALEQWSTIEADLQKIYQALNQNQCESLPFDPAQIMAPLPRAFQWLDGSAYLSHVERVRKAR